jgi:hypothetical protein
MKKIKWHLLLIALFGICAGYANKPLKLRTATGQTMHTYGYMSTQLGRYYYSIDCSGYGWTRGLDYDCMYPGGTICTFQADETRAHEDATGTWFWISDVPEAGVCYDGSFILMD